MPVPTDQLAEEIGNLSTEVKDLSKNLTDLRTESVGFRSAVETELRIIRWVGVFFSGALFSTIIGAVSVAWNALAVASEGRQQGQRLEKVEQKLESLGQLIPEVKQQGQRLEKVEQKLESLGQLIPEVKQQGQRLEKVEQKLESLGQRLEKQLELLINRTAPRS